MPKYLGPNAQKSKGISTRKRQVIARERYEKTSSHSGDRSSSAVGEQCCGARNAGHGLDQLRVRQEGAGRAVGEVSEDERRVERYLNPHSVFTREGAEWDGRLRG